MTRITVQTWLSGLDSVPGTALALGCSRGLPGGSALPLPRRWGIDECSVPVRDGAPASVVDGDSGRIPLRRFP